ncbi:MAG: peptidase M48, partial [Pseudomonadota bacterium]
DPGRYGVAVHHQLGGTLPAPLATAECYAMVGPMNDALIHSKRAPDLLPRGSTAWRQPLDVLSAAKTAAAQRKT